MSKPIIEVIMESGRHPALPDGLEPAIKFVNPDWTTHGGFSWYQPRKKWVTSDGPFSPKTCAPGGLHVANTIAAAQSGGARLTHCLWVGVEPDAGPWDSMGKRKARRVYVAGPIDLVGIIRSHGERANLEGADLAFADLTGANLQGANLRRAYLGRADLRGTNLREADLEDAHLGGVDLRSAYGRSDWDDLVARGAVRETTRKGGDQ